MTIIGIDLGTTNSLVSYFSDEGPIIIENSQNERLTPSVISVDDNGEIFVGKIAKERLITHPDKTVSIFKRSMGSKKEYKLGDKIFLAEELSSIIIKKLKEDAESFLGEKIEEAIISVPAYFNDAQRRSTKSAGELAGLKVERIINEPTAAAIAYGFHEKKDYTKFLIFDLGGGTFDVSILELYKNIMEVRAVAGDNFIGGEDFTNVLVNYFISQINKTIDDFTQKEIGIIKKSAEITKREFSTSKNATMKCVLKEESVEIDITYETYEKQCALLLGKLKKPISRALTDASINLDEIDTIILVGGATKSPLIRNYVSKLFGRLPASNINPDEVVALGAAISAAMKQRNQLVKEIVLTDVCPFTLGTNVSIEKQNGIYESGHFFPIIERNTIIPVSRVERLYTIYDNQKSIKIKILQGESRKSDNNVYLGEITVDVPARKKGTECIDVRYTYDVNGILEVDVTVLSTGDKKVIVIEKDSSSMTKEDVAKRLEELKELKIHPREKEEYSFVLSRGERIYEESVGSIRQYIASLLVNYEEILDRQDEREIRDSAQTLKKILDEIEEDQEY